MPHNLGPTVPVGYVEQYYTTYPGGNPRYISRPLDDSDDAAKHFTNACMWYDMLKPDLDDPFYIDCTTSGCELHLDHSESTGWPCMIIVGLEDECERSLLNSVLTKVVQMKKFVFQHLLSSLDCTNMRRTDSALSLSAPCGPYVGFVCVAHSRTLGAYEVGYYDVPSKVAERIKSRIYEWRIICDTDSVTDLKNMPRQPVRR